MNTPHLPGIDSHLHPERHNTALDSSAQHLKATAGAALSDGAGQAKGLVRQGAHAAQRRALHLRDSGCALIRQRPMQSVLVAAGAGAVGGLLLGLLVRGAAARQ
jgi:ElaB/YqjD/DUF883 family membrane-anchored ribosome-binding protein